MFLDGRDRDGQALCRLEEPAELVAGGGVGDGCGCGLCNRRRARPGLCRPGSDQGQGQAHRQQRAGQGSPVCRRPSSVSNGRLMGDMDNHCFLVPVGLTNVRSALAALLPSCDAQRRRRQDSEPDGVEAASRRGAAPSSVGWRPARPVTGIRAGSRASRRAAADGAALAHGPTDPPCHADVPVCCSTISRSVSRWSLKAMRPSGVSFSHVRGHLPT